MTGRGARGCVSIPLPCVFYLGGRAVNVTWVIKRCRDHMTQIAVVKQLHVFFMRPNANSGCRRVIAQISRRIDMVGVAMAGVARLRAAFLRMALRTGDAGIAARVILGMTCFAARQRPAALTNKIAVEFVAAVIHPVGRMRKCRVTCVTRDADVAALIILAMTRRAGLCIPAIVLQKCPMKLVA